MRKKLTLKHVLYLYVLISFTWIIASDYLLQFLDINPDHLFLVNTLKGFCFILISTFALTSLIKKYNETEQVKREKEKLEALFAAIPDIAIFKNAQGQWEQISSYGIDIMDLRHVKYKGKKASQFAKFSSAYSNEFFNSEKTDQETWEKKRPYRYIKSFQLSNGIKKTFDIIKIPMFHENGLKKGMLCIGRDITELKEAETKLREREKLAVVGELAAGIAHEIRNPLTTIKGFMQLVKENGVEMSVFQDLILSEIDRISSITTELLLLAKPQEGQTENVNVNDLLTHVTSFLITEANLKNICLRVKESDQEVIVRCIPHQLKQVFLNILKNAMEAIEYDGKIRVSVRIEKGRVRIRFKDNGCGIEEERLAHIGEPFFSTKEKGIGLGMAICFKIIKEHQGYIRMQSIVNEGTQVDVYLPYDEK